MLRKISTPVSEVTVSSVFLRLVLCEDFLLVSDPRLSSENLRFLRKLGVVLDKEEWLKVLLACLRN